jgi:hypothetical protein
MDIIDLRRLVRANDRGLLVRRDGHELAVVFAHVSTRWATVVAPTGAVRFEDVLRTTLVAAGTRVAVAFEVLEVSAGSTGDTLELTVVSATVLGERRAPAPVVDPGAVTAIHVRSDGIVVRAPARVAEAEESRLAFVADDRFAPGDEVTLAADGSAGFRVRVRVVRRSPGADGMRFETRLVAATAEDELRVRALVAVA